MTIKTTFGACACANDCCCHHCQRYPMITFKRRRKACLVHVLALILLGRTAPSMANSSSSNNNNENKAEQMLSSFFDKLHSLEEQYGSNLVTVQDVTDIYPLLLQTKTDNIDTDSHGVLEEDCPMKNYYYHSSRNYNMQQQQEEKKMTCHTPIVIIHDRIANSILFDQSQSQQQQQQQQQQQYYYLPEVLLLSGLDIPFQMDIFGPSSIYETLKLLLDCAVCEALSPWVVGSSSTSASALPLNNGTTNAGLTTAKEDTTTTSAAAAAANNSNDAAIQCRNELQSQGINNKLRQWLARLVATRKIIALPIVDVAGFYNRLEQKEEREGGGDGEDDGPSDTASSSSTVSTINKVSLPWSQCDFPYPARWKSSSSSPSSSSACMRTFPAKVMNEVFRTHAIQLGLAFHGGHINGDVSLPNGGWIGVPSWKSAAASAPISASSVDEDAMTEISWAYSMLGWSSNNINNNNNGSPSYSVQTVSPKTTSDTVIHEQADKDCNGATLEHWAFSAGVTINIEPDSEGVSILLEQCTGDYPPPERSNHNTLSLRSFVASVVAPSFNNESPRCLPGFEINDDKLCRPDNNNDNDLHFFFDSSRVGTNIRMSILATELVEPWTSIRSIAGVELRDDDVIPLSQRVPERCLEARSMILPESLLMKDVNITWAVGGAFTVSETAIMHGKWDVLDKKIFDCVTQPTKQELDAFFTILRDFEMREGESAQEMEDDVSFTPIQTGVTRWHPSLLNSAARGAFPDETIFSVSLDLSDYKVGDVISLYALARADQREYAGQSPPQSSFVNLRTNPDWSHTYTGMDGSSSTIQGRLDWFSMPVTITIGEQPGFFQNNQPVETSLRISDIGLITNYDSGMKDIVYPLLAAVVAVAVVFFCAFCREESDGTDVFSVLKEHREIKRQRISMEEFFREESEEETVQLELI